VMALFERTLPARKISWQTSASVVLTPRRLPS
jgi:hypothetical protein